MNGGAGIAPRASKDAAGPFLGSDGWRDWPVFEPMRGGITASSEDGFWLQYLMILGNLQLSLFINSLYGSGWLTQSVTPVLPSLHPCSGRLHPLCLLAGPLGPCMPPLEINTP